MNPDGENYEPRYKEYELKLQERSSLQEIRDHLATGYSDQQTLRNHINYLEKLSSRVRDIIRAEESQGYNNETLKHDFRQMQSLQQRLAETLDALDA